LSRFTRILFAIVCLFVTMTASAQETEQIDLYFEGETALAHVAAHVGVGPRPPATVGNVAAGNLILDHLGNLEGWRTREDWHVIGMGDRAGFTPEAVQTFELWQPVTVDGLLTDYFSEQGHPVDFESVFIPVRNLVGSYGGGRTIIIGAHYDSRILSDKDVDESRRLLPMPGANDGGSGVGVLLEMARVLSEHYTPNQEIRFVFFDAEDQGSIEPFPALLPSTRGYLIGSTLYASRLDLTTEQIDYMLLVDLVGEFDQQFPIEGYSNQSAPELVTDIWSAAAELGYAEQFPMEVRSAIIDDHLPFIQRGIPAVDIIDLNYAYWDTSEDTLDKISADSLERVGRVLEYYLLTSGAITPKVRP